jgi:hypothetical protein
VLVTLSSIEATTQVLAKVIDRSGIVVDDVEEEKEEEQVDP